MCTSRMAVTGQQERWAGPAGPVPLGRFADTRPALRRRVGSNVFLGQGVRDNMGWIFLFQVQSNIIL